MSGIRRIGKEWLLLAVGLIAVGVITQLSATKSAVHYPALSPSSTRPDGAAAAYQWLSSLGYHTRQTRSLVLSETSARNTTLWLLQPQRNLRLQEAKGLVAWIRKGGVVVAASRPSMDALYKQAQAGERGSPSPVTKVIEPLLGDPPVSRIFATASSGLATHQGVAVALTDAGDPALVRISLGRGVLWLTSAHNALDNAHLVHAGNPTLLVSLAGRRGRNVDFVGLPSVAPPASARSSRSLFALPWGIAILFSGALLLAFRWLSGWRLGPPVSQPQVNARPATDYVIALAGLLRKAKRRSEVLQMYVDTSARGNRTRIGGGELPPELCDIPEKIDDEDLVRRARQLVERAGAEERQG